MQACAEWVSGQFAQAGAAAEAQGKAVIRVLWFNLSGQRDPAALLAPFAALLPQFPIHYGLFCPNITHFRDMVNSTTAVATQTAMSRHCLDAWQTAAPACTTLLSASITGLWRRTRRISNWSLGWVGRIVPDTATRHSNQAPWFVCLYVSPLFMPTFHQVQ